MKNSCALLFLTSVFALEDAAVERQFELEISIVLGEMIQFLAQDLKLQLALLEFRVFADQFTQAIVTNAKQVGFLEESNGSWGT